MAKMIYDSGDPYENKSIEGWTEADLDIYNHGFARGCTYAKTVSKTASDMVNEFHEKFEQEKYSEKEECYYSPNLERYVYQHDTQLGLIAEELEELIQAIEDQDIVSVADALGDLAYVVLGMAWKLNLPFDEIFAEIHRSNMSKLGEDGKPILREDGKILKGPNYSPPNLQPIIERGNL